MTVRSTCFRVSGFRRRRRSERICWVNNPRRTQDLEDIKALLRANRDTLNIAEVREYFRLFDRENQLDDLLNETT